MLSFLIGGGIYIVVVTTLLLWSLLERADLKNNYQRMSEDYLNLLAETRDLQHRYIHMVNEHHERK
jgi:hypothetical protein